jgi:hypothetical protein
VSETDFSVRRPEQYEFIKFLLACFIRLEGKTTLKRGLSGWPAEFTAARGFCHTHTHTHTHTALVLSVQVVFVHVTACAHTHTCVTVSDTRW